MKRKKYLDAGNTTKDTQKAHSQMEHSIPRAEQKPAQSLSGQPRSTPTGRQICQKAICSSLAQPNLVRNETGGCWVLGMDARDSSEWKMGHGEEGS